MNVLSRLSLIAVVAVSAACDDDRANQLPTAPVSVAPDALSAYVSVSNPNAKVGDHVTVTVRALRGSAVGPIGSFTVRLAYDSTRLSFREAGRNAQGMVMTNAANRGVVVAAGASAEGFGSDELVSATFDVTATGALASLALTVSELNSLAFENQMSRMKVMKGIYRDAPAVK
jgi:hypothetical protein